MLFCIVLGQPGTSGRPGTPGAPGLPGSYPNFPKPSPSPAYPDNGSVSGKYLNLLPVGYIFRFQSQRTFVFDVGYPSSVEVTQTGYPNQPPSYPDQSGYPVGYPQNPNYGEQLNGYPAGFVSPGYSVPSQSFGPYPNYPQPDVPSGYEGYFELNPIQGHVYPDDPQYQSVYPAAAGKPNNVDVNIYTEKQLNYPKKENKLIKSPQVTSAAPVAPSVTPSYADKTSESPAEDGNNAGLIDVRINYSDKTDGQKSVVLGKSELSLTPSSGSSGYPSSLNPQYVNSPTTKAPTKTPYRADQQSNLVILPSAKPESSTPLLYSVSTKTVPQPTNGNYPEQPSGTPSYGEQFSTVSPDSAATPVNVIPYALPIVPNPGSCPCYFVPPTSNSTEHSQPQQPATFDVNNLPEGAVIGFVPVVFYPSCGGGVGGGGGVSKESLSSKLEPVFPSAYQVPYKCSYCEQSESQTASIRNSFDQAVRQSQLHPSVVVKSAGRKPYAPLVSDQQEFGKKTKVTRRKSRNEDN